MNAKGTPSASASFSVPVSCFSVSFLLQCSFLFWSALFSFFCSPFPVPPFSSFCFLVQSLFLFFLVHVFPLFSPKTFLNPKHFSVQPKTFFSSAQNLFFSPKRFCFKSPTCCSFKFSPPFFFCACLLLSFLPTSKAIKKSSFSSVYPRPIFSLAASHLFYLNKSLFSLNLE